MTFRKAAMTPSGKKLRIAQPVRQVTMDVSLLPKLPAKAGPGEGKTTVNIVAPVAPQVAAMRQKLKQQSVRSQIARVDAAIEAGAVSAADAKALVLALAMKRLGSKETAEKWYRGQHLEAFGGRTPAQMVRGGELKALVALMRAEAAQNKA
jgi:hypothetical protein